MNPVFFEAGPLTIHWYGVFMALAFAAGFTNWLILGRARGFNAVFCSDLLFWVMLAGVLGARLTYVLSDLDFYLRNPSHIYRIHEGGLIFYGGFIGATAAVCLFARKRGIRILALGDFVCTSLPLGHAIGRIGCFMNGCCFGAPTETAPGCTFPHGSLPWHRQRYDLNLIDDSALRSLPVHPVQLYETGTNLLVYALLVFLFLRVKRPGIVTGAYFLAYPPARLLLENLRGTERLMSGQVSAAQWLSILLMAVGLAILVRSLRRPPSATNLTTG